MADTLTFIFCIVAAVLAFGNLSTELRRQLMMLQQNSYRRERYLRWLRESRDSASAWKICAAIAALAALLPFCPTAAGLVLMGGFAIVSILSLLRRKYKKPLVMTPRALRIYLTAIAISAIVSAAAGIAFAGAPVYALAVCLTFEYFLAALVIILANAVLGPVEKAINRRYIRDAERILSSMPELKIIGITGSYGKTTTKHYLHRILSEKYETLMTPGSYNTPLGVVRTVRELLKPYHEVFIVEMGAKARGDIEEICDIVHPTRGIITAVGPQHLESFKSIDNVQATKFELADALPADGLIVVNNDFEKIADRPVGNTRCARYAVKNITPEVDWTATDIRYSAAGTSFTVRNTHTGEELPLTTPLVGECNISNVLAAVVMAREMGVDSRQIAYAVEHLQQVEHRLSIRRIPGGLTIIDDAFNSNPVGSAMALDVLAAMKPGRRILITPGMIELGTEQERLNREFGRKAAASADEVIVVGHYNRAAIASGLDQGGMDKARVHLADSFAQAQAILGRIAAAGDTVLYENDLPDTFK